MKGHTRLHRVKILKIQKVIRNEKNPIDSLQLAM